MVRNAVVFQIVAWAAVSCAEQGAECDRAPRLSARLVPAVGTAGQQAAAQAARLKVASGIHAVTRLATSEKARHSIIRHAFRFFMGRNEMLSDAQPLIDADQAYVKSGGSFKAVVVSLLTSDSLMYRKPLKD